MLKVGTKVIVGVPEGCEGSPRFKEDRYDGVVISVMGDLMEIDIGQFFPYLYEMHEILAVLDDTK